MATGNQLHALQEKVTFSGAVVFSPDSKNFGFANADGTIQLREVATAKEIRRLTTGQKQTRFLAFSPDGRLLAAQADKTIQVWSAESGKQLLQVGGTSRIISAAFSPSSRLLAASEILAQEGVGVTCKVVLWEVVSGRELRRIALQPGLNFPLAFAPDGRTLATGGNDSTILLWDLTGQRTGKLKTVPLSAKDLEGLWSDLAGEVPSADSAIWQMVFAPEKSLPLLQERMRPVAPAAAAEVAKLLADLNSEQFAVRQKAAKALETLGEAAEAALRKSLEGNITLEVRQRVQQLLEKRDRDALRKLRAMEVLEQIGTAEARRVLAEQAIGSPNPRVAQAAAVALERMAARQP